MRTRLILLLPLLLLLLLLSLAPASGRAAGATGEKPKVAVFPLGGEADPNLRERTAFALRTKLDRDGAYDPIAGVDMQDLAAGAKEPVTFDTAPAVVKSLAADSGAKLLIWGDVQPGDGVGTLRLKVLDLREPEEPAGAFVEPVHAPTDLRFVLEQVLETLPGVGPFEHPDEEEVHHSPASDAAFARNPNLVVNGDFSQPGHWDGIYLTEKDAVALSDALPEPDKVCIYRTPAKGGEPANDVLAMNLSLTCAQNNGLACLSEPIAIRPGTKYRLRFRYKSDGPVLHVFVKGYTTGKNVAGEKALREVYRRQVSPTGATDGQWTTIESDLNPQNAQRPVEFLKVDLYAYLNAGVVLFDDVELKEIGRQGARDVMRDTAIPRPTSGPSGAR